MADHQFRRERAGDTLQPTALVNEAFIRLIGGRPTEWANRAHFFGAAAQAMRRVLIERSRSKHAQKRGGVRLDVTSLTDLAERSPQHTLDAVDVDRALLRLAALDERQARIAELRIFAGLEHEEIAELLEISSRTVKREWRIARAFLAQALRP